jgi:hypothetical protein
MTELEKAEAECDRLLKLAHDAPLNPYRLDADGHRWVEQISQAWSNRSNDWIKACEHRDRLRSLVGTLPHD